MPFNEKPAASQTAGVAERMSRPVTLRLRRVEPFFVRARERLVATRPPDAGGFVSVAAHSMAVPRARG